MVKPFLGYTHLTKLVYWIKFDLIRLDLILDLRGYTKINKHNIMKGLKLRDVENNI